MEWTNTINELEKFGHRFTDEYRNLLEAENVNASYALSDSVDYIVETDDDAIQVSISLLDYWKRVEYGTQPGTIVDRKDLEKWIRVKRVVPRPLNNGKLPTTQQLAYLIQHKIYEQGIEERPLFEMTLEEVWNDFNARIEQAVTRDIEQNLDQIMNIF